MLGMKGIVIDDNSSSEDETEVIPVVRDPNDPNNYSSSSFSNIEGQAEQEAFDQYLKHWGAKIAQGGMANSAYTDVLPNQPVQHAEKVNVTDGFTNPKRYAQGQIMVPEFPSESEESSAYDPKDELTSKIVRRKINL